MNPRLTSLWIPAISIKSNSCQEESNGYNALHNAVHNCNQSQHCTIDIFLFGQFHAGQSTAGAGTLVVAQDTVPLWSKCTLLPREE